MAVPAQPQPFLTSGGLVGGLDVVLVVFVVNIFVVNIFMVNIFAVNIFEVNIFMVEVFVVNIIAVTVDQVGSLVVFAKLCFISSWVKGRCCRIVSVSLLLSSVFPLRWTHLPVTHSSGAYLRVQHWQAWFNVPVLELHSTE